MINRHTRPNFQLIGSAVLLATIAVTLYLPALSADFLWDSRPQILTDDYIHIPRHLTDVLTLRVLSLDVLDNDRPANLLTLMVDSLLWEKNPFGYHLTSVLWHAGTVVLLFFFCRNFAPDAWAFCVALIFAVHPVNCEAVAEVSYREDLLAAFFVLAGLNFATFFKPERSRKNLIIGFSSVFCFFAAICAKENGIAGPVVLFGYWLLFRHDESRKGWLVLVAAASVAVGGFLAVLFLLEPKNSVIFLHRPQQLGGSLINTLHIQSRIFAFYLRQIVLPQDFCADYGPYSIRNFSFAVSFAVLMAVVAAQIILSSRNPAFALGAGIFWFSLLPVSNLIPIFRPMADRFLYLPMTGVSLMLTAFAGFRAWRPAVPVVILAALALAPVTFQREKVWHNSLALWTDTLEKNPLNADAANNLGGALFYEGRLTESVASYERAINLSNGKIAEVFAEMALPLDALGRRAEADAAFKKAVALDGLYAHPELLVKALIFERKDAEKLQIIAGRN